MSQAVIHLNDQPERPVARLGTPAEAPGTIKAWKPQEAVGAPTCTIDQGAMLLSTSTADTWERYQLLRFAVRHPARTGELLCTPE